MTFGYNSSFLKANTKTSATVLDFAKDLLYDLKYAKDGEMGDLGVGDVPVIFLVHSMGGLIVKEAYMQGQYDPEFRAIVDAISAIIFLSTPHRGTNLAETLNRILQASIISSPKQFISELTKNSFTLQKLNEQFRHVAPKLDIVSFYETQMTPIGFHKNKIMVLEKDSSVLGYPGEISKALDADHHGVCKFDSPEDPLYVNVRNVLKSLISKYPVLGPGDASIPTKHEDLREIEKILAISEPPDTDYIFFRDRWTSGTCGWMLLEENFLEWMHVMTPRPMVLWLHGAAASGKSVLSSFVIDHLAQLGLSCQYFFVRFGDQLKRSLSTVLRSLAFQIAQDLPSFRQGLVKLMTGTAKLDTANVQTIWNRVFKSILFRLNFDAPLYWVIDGLDESDDPRILIRLLSESNFAELPIRVLVVSRKTQALTAAFQRLSKEVKLSMVDFEGTSGDISAFLDQELDVSGDEGFRGRVKRKILEQAQGNFLWVTLAVQRINDSHTTANVEQALQQLPSGMEALYDRMATSINVLPQQEDKKLASSVLAWCTCAIRLLTIEELSLVIEKDGSKPLDLQHSIGDLCGGFVVIDNGGNVAMVHQTAREYLIDGQARPFRIDSKTTHALLFARCMDFLTDFGLRSKITRKHVPAFLDYAAHFWFYHLPLSSVQSPGVIATLEAFLKGTAVLTWIHFLAQANRLRALILASNQLNVFVMKRKDMTAVLPEKYAFLQAWAVDLVKIVGKFGPNLLKSPDAIYKLIPPFCPDSSILYQRFGKSQGNTLKITGQSFSEWDDSLARLSFGTGVHVTSIKAAGSHVAVLNPAGTVIVYYASTYEESRRIKHGERVLRMQFSPSGLLLVTYGYLTTKVWELSSGNCVASVRNPVHRPRPHTIVVTDDDSRVLVGTDDRRIRSLSLNDSTVTWLAVADIDEQALEGTVVNSPTCMALSPDCIHVALGYRGHPLSVWEVQGPELVGHCLRVLDESTQSNAVHSWGEIVQLTWHPYTGEVVGLYLEGVVFRWHPYHDETQELHTGANSIVVSQDGKCLATGDPNGIIKLYDLGNFSLVYQFASQDPVFSLDLAPDSRRLYDIRGSYANVWEPDALLRLSEATGTLDEEEIEPNSTLRRNPCKTDPITTLSAQPSGQVYCLGTEDGVFQLFEAGREDVIELQKSRSFMSIEHAAWSDDGRYVSFTDLSGKIYVNTVQSARGNLGSWTIEAELEIPMTLSDGIIRQLVFSADSTKILVYTGSTISIISLSKKSVDVYQRLDETGKCYKWMNHPAQLGLVLGLHPGYIQIRSWSTLAQIHRVTYPTAVLEGDMMRSQASLSASLWDSGEYVEKALVTRDKSFILVQASVPVEKGRKHKEIVVLRVSDIPSNEEPGSTEDPKELGAEDRTTHISDRISSQEAEGLPVDKEHHSLDLTHLPAELTSQIEIPLAFLSRHRLVFLDRNFWLCSWRLPLPSDTTNRRPSATGSLDGGTSEIKQHYFFPSDWISPDSVALCTVMDDGTVLCARNGNVAVVKCSTLRC